MRITFLGSGHGVPTAARHCTSTMITAGGCAYLFDCGAPVADCLAQAGVRVEDVRGVFLTHMHGDHTFGLPALCSIASWYYRTSSFDVFFPEACGIDAMRAWILAADKSFDEERIRLHLFQEGIVYADENVVVSAHRTEHMQNGLPSCAFVIEGEGQRIVIAGDLHHGDARDFPVIARTEPSDAVVCELCHFPPSVIFPIADACPTKRFFFHHVWGNVEANLAAAAEFARRAKPLVITPSDGDAYDL